MLYMAVTADKYELPLCVGTVQEVAAWANISVKYLYSQISKAKTGRLNGKSSGRIFVRVEEE